MAERWADLTLALALYPETNSRVLSAFTAFFAALRERMDAGTKAVEIAFSAKAARVGDDVFAFKPGGNLAWLKERLDRADLAGAAFAEGVPEASVLAFVKKLLEVYRRRDVTGGFAALWPETFQGVTPLERRFDGSFSGPEETDGPVVEHGRSRAPRSLEEKLHRDPRIRGSLEAIHAKLLARAGSAAEFSRLDLVAEVVGLLPAEALQDHEKAVDVTANVLTDLEGEFADNLRPTLLTHGGDAAFRHLLFVISRTHFSSAEAEKPTGGAGKRVAMPKFEFERTTPVASRREDDKVTDDLGSLLSEMEALGPSTREPVAADEVDDRREQIAVFLHYVATADDLARFPTFRETLGRLLDSAGPRGAVALCEYLDPARGDAGPARERAIRIARWLRRNGLGDHLAACGILDAAWAGRTFPAGFPTYLESLDLEEAEDRTELDRVCRTIGRQRFGEATDFGPRTKEFLAGPIPGKLFALVMPSAGPFVRRIYETDKRRFEPGFARFLRATSATPLDREILDVLEARFLLPDYLSALADGDAERLAKQRPLVVWASLLATANDPAKLEQYIKAIRLLASFDTPQTHEYLKNLIAERELVVFKKNAPEARRAAVEVLKALESRRPTPNKGRRSPHV